MAEDDSGEEMMNHESKCELLYAYLSQCLLNRVDFPSYAFGDCGF